MALRPDDRYLADLLAGRTAVATAALSGSSVVGLAIYVLSKFEQTWTDLCVYDLAVDESYRRQGAATAMLKICARQHGIHIIFVQVDHGDDLAIACYTKLGVRDQTLHFDMPL